MRISANLFQNLTLSKKKNKGQFQYGRLRMFIAYVDPRSLDDRPGIGMRAIDKGLTIKTSKSAAAVDILLGTLQLNI